MNLKGFSNNLIVVFLLFNVFNSLAQDIIITKKGQDIPSKVLEISLTTVKYKRFDNINGPIYNIPKVDVLMIRYQNGTKEILNSSSIKNDSQIGKNQPSIKEEKDNKTDKQIVFIEKKKNEPIIEPIKEKVNEPIKEPKSSQKQELIKEQLPTVSEKKIIPFQITEEKTIEQSRVLSNEYIKYNNKKLIWGIGAIVTAGVGAFSIIQSNSLYSDYKTATTQANSIHSQIESLNIVSPIAFALAGFSALEFFVQQSKQNKVVKFKIIPDKNAVSGIRLGLNYSF
jgi:hypothetical protein